jgi:tRNA(Phe) wybutosine-synthesizing methylase Tyw3
MNFTEVKEFLTEQKIRTLQAAISSFIATMQAENFTTAEMLLALARDASNRGFDDVAVALEILAEKYEFEEKYGDIIDGTK